MHAPPRSVTLTRRAAAATLVAGILGTVLAGGGAAATHRTPASSAASPAAVTGLSAWGDNSGGELGNGSFNQSDSPVAGPALSGVKAISAGYRFNLALLSAGTVSAWGENQFGQLGNGTTTDSTVAATVPGVSGVVEVAAGGGHSLALLANGTVTAWGDNAFGQLGDGTTTNRSAPVLVKGLSGVRAIAAGQLGSLALLSDGSVMAWGDDRDGELGNGAFGVNSSVPVAVRGLTGVTAISAGGFFDVALLGNSTVMAWGEGDEGELGNGGTTAEDLPVTVTGLSGVSSISAGSDYALAVTKTGTGVAWGANNFGQLGNPAAGAGSDVPVAIPGLSGVTALAGGGQSSLALLSSGTAESWGDNALGQLGNATTTDSSAPVPVAGLSSVQAIANGANHALALAAPTPPAGSGPATPWGVVPTPNPGAPPPPGIASVSFSGVSAASASDAWVVGTNDNFGGNSFPVSAHWNGSTGGAVAMPTPPGLQGTITAVHDVSPGDAWAVGQTTDPATTVERTLIEHWNGTNWTIVPSPNPQGGSTGNDALEAIDGVSANDIWAVGFDFTPPAAISLLFEHFNGVSWSAVPSPPPVGDDFGLGITTITSNDAWAVGTNASQTTLAAHWNGTTWSIVPTPSPMDGPSPTNQLTGVTAVASNNVWASGYEDNVNDTNFRKPYLLHWNGSSWKLIFAPNPGTEGSLLRAITALSANDIWTVGQTQENDGSILTLTEQFNGTTWNVIPSPDPGGVGPLISNTLDGVASPSGRIVLSIGSQDTLGLCCTRTFALATAKG